MAKLTSPEDVAKLEAEVERLSKALEDSEHGRAAAEEEARRIAASKGMLNHADIEEVPTGESVKVKKAKDPANPALGWKEVEEPTYFYKIGLPPSGGTGIQINGVWYYHGQTYKVTLDLLRTLKDQVYKSWAHERSIRGDNENERAYRRPAASVLRGGERRARA